MFAPPRDVPIAPTFPVLPALPCIVPASAPI